MSSLEYVRTNTVPKDKLYGMFHKCKKCAYITKSSFFIRNHVKRHQCTDPLDWFDCSKHDPECFTCNDCNFVTYLNRTFENHLRNHVVKAENTETSFGENTSDPIHDYYSKTFTQDYQKGSECLSKSREWLHCDKCSFRCKLRSTLYRHNINKHKLEEIKWFHCDQCSYKTRCKQYIKRHMNRQHQEFCICKSCDFSSYDVGTFRNHVKSHLLEPDNLKESILTNWRKKIVGNELKTEHTFENIICKIADDLKNIKKQNNGSGSQNADIEPVKKKPKKRKPPENLTFLYCDECSYRSKNKYALQRHKKHRHTPSEHIKWFLCDQCASLFKHKCDLDRHIIYKHNPEKGERFYCDKCPFKCERKTRLKRHVINHHTPAEEINWFQCEHCPYKSKSKSNLKKHTLNRHTISEVVAL